MNKSAFLALKKNDLVRGAFMAAAATFGNTLLQLINNGMKLPTHADLILSLKMGVGAVIVYLVKNLLTNSDDKLLKKEVKA